MGQTMKIATVTLNPAIDWTISIPNFWAGAV
jgi:fructose-1-phosphate kinase PfkB-like protein